MTEKRLWTKGEKKGYGMIEGAWSHCRRKCSSREAGQVLIFVALALFVLIGSVALAVDIGYFRYKKRDMQKAADAGAIGGATDLINTGDYDSGAKHDTSENGFTQGEDGVIVTVNNPPLSGPHKDLPEKDNYVEVIIEQDQPTFFARIFGINSSKVVARAVARGGMEQGDACVYALNPDANRALRVEGAANVHADCNICVSSDDPGALTVGGGSPSNPSEIIAEGISIVGGYVKNGANATIVPEPDTGDTGPYCGDPLADITSPENWQSMDCKATNLIINTGEKTTLSPGRYCGGIKVNSGGEVHFEDGLYIIDGSKYGFQNAAGSTLTGENVTFYNTGGGPYGDGKITINGNSATDLKAGATGYLDGKGNEMYAGILFYQDPQNTQEAKFNGNSETTMLGGLYFPTALVTFDGQNDTTVGFTMVVADTLKFTGGATFHIENDTSGGPSSTPPVLKVVLVE